MIIWKNLPHTAKFASLPSLKRTVSRLLIIRDSEITIFFRIFEVFLISQFQCVCGLLCSGIGLHACTVVACCVAQIFYCSVSFLFHFQYTVSK